MGFNPQTFIDSRQQTESTGTPFDPDKFLSTREMDTPSFDPKKFIKDQIGPGFGSPETLAFDTLVEGGNLGEMVLALPEIIGGAGGTIAAGTLDYIIEQGKANIKETELKKRIKDGEEIPIDEHVKILSDIGKVTWKKSFSKMGPLARESAEDLNLGGHLGTFIEFYSKQLGLESEYKEFKENYDDRSKLSATTRFMSAVGHGIEEGAEGIEKKVGIPKEASVAVAELLLLRANAIVKGTKNILLDKTGVTTVAKRAGDTIGLKTSDLAKDKEFINTILKDKVTKEKPFKEGPIEAQARADAFERKMEGTLYGPWLRQNKGELPTNYESGMAYFNNLKENIDTLEKTLKEAKTQEDFELSMANIAKQQVQTDKIIIKEVYQSIQGKYIKERGKKAYDDFIKRVELKQEGQKIKLDSLEQEIWNNVYIPLRKFNKMGTLKLGRHGKLEYNDIIIDPKVAGHFQPRIYMHKANTWLQGIVENVTGSRVRGKQMEGEVAMFGEQRSSIAATRGQEYYAVERPIPIKLFEYLNNWKNNKEIIRDAQVPARGPSPKNLDGTTNWKIKGPILRNPDGSIIMTNRGIFQEFSRFLWLADQLNVFPGRRPQIYGMIKSFAGSKTSKAKALQHLFTAQIKIKEFNKKYQGVVETKKMKQEYEILEAAKKDAQRKIDNVDYYQKNKVKYHAKVQEIMDTIDKKIKREIISIDEVVMKDGTGNYVVNRFIKNKKGKMVRIPDRMLSYARSQRDSIVPGHSLSTRSQRATIKHATRREIEETVRNADGTKQAQIKDPFLVELLKSGEIAQALRDLGIDRSLTESPYMKERAKRDPSDPDPVAVPKDYIGRPKKGAKEQSIETTRPGVDFTKEGFPELEGLRTDKVTAEILEDVFRRREPNIVNQVSNAMIRNMLLNPLPHIHNEIIHLVSTAGISAFVTPKGRKELSQAMKDGWDDVVGVSDLYVKARVAGAPIMSTNVITENYFKPLLKEAQDKSGFDIKSPLIKEIAKKTGTKVADVYGSIGDKISRQGMWMSRDIMYMALLRLKMKHHPKLGLEGAIKLVDAHMPTYRMNPRVGEKILGAQMSRLLSKHILQNPTIAIFARYKHGFIKSGLNTIRDIGRGTDPILRKFGKVGESVADFIDAEGARLGRTPQAQLREGLESGAALAVMSTLIYPLIDMMLTETLGDDSEAHIRRGGILHFVDTLQGVVTGKKDNYALFSNLFTINPVLQVAAELGMNTTFYNGRQIYDVRDPLGQTAVNLLDNMLTRIPMVSNVINSQDDMQEFDAVKFLFRNVDIRLKTKKQILSALKNQERQDTAAENRARERLREELLEDLR
jgi:hypothetical protein|tara:strand:- start:149 stop:4123 length:3975 start_codon:yes stop_codon:yes gene_type:complete